MNSDIVAGEELMLAIKNKSPIHIKKQLSVLPDWSDIINSVDYAMKEDSIQESPINCDQVGNVRFFDRLLLAINHAERYDYPGLKEIYEYFKSLNVELLKALVIVHFSSLQKTTGRHYDEKSVMYIQLINSVVWNVWENGLKKEFILEPGDIMFMPKMIEHEVVPIMPRVGITFGVKDI
jgi:ribosomal protein L16 Arg81 hydroxylase